MKMLFYSNEKSEFGKTPETRCVSQKLNEIFLKLELLMIIKFGKLQCYIVAYQCSIWEMSARPTNLN